jgi:hypothetical protein
VRYVSINTASGTQKLINYCVE